MTQQPVLSDSEWTVVAELLNAERRDLPAEIHHTDNREVRDQLQERLRTVDRAIEKVRLATAAPATA